MAGPAAKEVLKLYKNLLRYSEQVVFTDQGYFKKRIKIEFKNNIKLTETKDINFFYNRGQELLKLKRVV